MEGRPNFAAPLGRSLGAVDLSAVRDLTLAIRNELVEVCDRTADFQSDVGALVVYALQRLQQWLPFNPQHFSAR